MPTTMTYTTRARVEAQESAQFWRGLQYGVQFHICELLMMHGEDRAITAYPPLRQLLKYYTPYRRIDHAGNRQPVLGERCGNCGRSSKPGEAHDRDTGKCFFSAGKFRWIAD